MHTKDQTQHHWISGQDTHAGTHFFLYPDWHQPLIFLPQVNDDLLVKIASRRQNVTEINISDCRGVHDHGVSSLASHCPSLQKYTAYRCKQLGDASLSALATHCPLLVKVHVGNQDKLTDESLKKVRSLRLGCFCRLEEVHNCSLLYNFAHLWKACLRTHCCCNSIFIIKQTHLFICFLKADFSIVN